MAREETLQRCSLKVHAATCNPNVQHLATPSPHTSCPSRVPAPIPNQLQPPDPAQAGQPSHPPWEERQETAPCTEKCC